MSKNIILIKNPQHKLSQSIVKLKYTLRWKKNDMFFNGRHFFVIIKIKKFILHFEEERLNTNLSVSFQIF